jgi:serine/threonine protein phosphatase PrpC
MDNPNTIAETMHIDSFYRPHYHKIRMANEVTSWFQSKEVLALLKLNHPLDKVECHSAGQDYTLVINQVKGDIQQSLVGVADGHGTMGHLHSYVATRLLANKLLSCWDIFQLHLKQNKLVPISEKIRELIDYCYSETHQLMFRKNIFPQLDKDSGTTMAMALIVVVEGNRFLISTNAGDSQILWSDKIGDVQECSMDHNCDNPEAVKLYVTRLKNKRQQLKAQIDNLEKTATNYTESKADLERQFKECFPKPIYYSRINCGGPIWDMFCNDQGVPTPIPVYSYEGPEYDIVKLDKDGYEKVSTYYPHGHQSLRYPETCVREDGRTVAVPGHETDNWGSTLNGQSQVLNGFGDLYQHPHNSYTPHVTVKHINQEGRLVLATDGLSDLFYFKDLINAFWNWDKEKNMTNFTDYLDYFDQLLFEIANREPIFPFTANGNLKFPQWDDVSGIFITLPNMKDGNKQICTEDKPMIPTLRPLVQEDLESLDL